MPVHSRNVRPQAGYVLLMTLILITLMSVALSRVVQQSLELANEANEKQETLQRKWALHGLRRTVLDRADAILASRAMQRGDSQESWPEPHQLTLELPLGKLHYRLTLADEDAKAQLHRAGKIALAAHISQTVARLAPLTSSLTLHVRPFTWNPTIEGSRAMESWGQIFELGLSGNATHEARTLRDATAQITCWGSDRLNVRRAPEAVVREVLRDLLSDKQLKEFAKVRAKHALGATLEALLQQLQLDADQYFTLRERLTEHGTSFTLWIESSSHDAARLQLLVRNPGGPQAPRRLSFEW